MWIETRGRQHRVYWRTGQASPRKTFEPFASRDAAELFVDLARRAGSLSGALEYVRDPRPETLRKLLGMAPLPAPAQTPAPCAPQALLRPAVGTYARTAPRASRARPLTRRGGQVGSTGAGVGTPHAGTVEWDWLSRECRAAAGLVSR